MYELLFPGQQPKAKDFRRHCFDLFFPHVLQQLSDRSHAMEVKSLTNRAQTVEITNEAHQQTIEDKDAVLQCSMMIYKIVTTKYRSFSMKTWHCKHKGMYIRTNYKNFKTSLPILGPVMSFLCLATGCKSFFGPNEIKKIRFLVQCSDEESFKFNDKRIMAFYIKDVGQCLISQDVYTAMGYEKENGIITMQRLVPEKYKIRLGNAMIDMKGVGKDIHYHPDTVSLKEPDLYCLL